MKTESRRGTAGYEWQLGEDQQNSHGGEGDNWGWLWQEKKPAKMAEK